MSYQLKFERIIEMDDQLKFELWVGNTNIRGDAYGGACQGWHGCEIDKRDARVAQLEEALKAYQSVEALSTSSDIWLADKIKEAEIKVLEEAAEYFRSGWESTPTGDLMDMADERRAK